MRCKDVRRSFHRFLDGELEAAGVLELQEHMAVCGACREYWRDLHDMHVELRGLPRSIAPRDFTEVVLERAVHSQAQPARHVRYIPAMAIAGLCTVIVAVVSIRLG
ncbi:zf-HC2 domain-containing protein, partial [bacterium]|nr:zf-HC2 domain-containing protein [candidate division CSSED10-310 bacterium]